MLYIDWGQGWEYRALIARRGPRLGESRVVDRGEDAGEAIHLCQGEEGEDKLSAWDDESTVGVGGFPSSGRTSLDRKASDRRASEIVEVKGEKVL